MPSRTTLAELLEMAILLERTFEGVYHRLESKFRGHPAAAAFWRQYALEEDAHAQWLEGLREQRNVRKLSALADPRMANYAEQALSAPIPQALDEIHNMEDAYQLANRLENGEINIVFEFLINTLADPAAQKTMLTQLRSHVSRMRHFPAGLHEAELRREVLAD